jgi:hypothetical protein
MVTCWQTEQITLVDLAFCQFLSSVEERWVRDWESLTRRRSLPGAQPVKAYVWLSQSCSSWYLSLLVKNVLSLRVR